MRSAKELKGIAIVDVAGGIKLGTVDEIVVSPDDGRLLAFVMKSGGLFSSEELIVDASDVRSIGPDAITVEGQAVAQTPANVADEIKAARSADRALVGKRVVTKDGAVAGTITDYALDERALRVVALTLGGGMFERDQTVPADQIVSVGPDVVVILGDQPADEGERPFIRR